jgi:hypothetical protein
MTQTKAQRRKQKKKKTREKRIKKERNFQKNLAPARWRLDVYVPDEGWGIKVKQFRKWEQVEAHKEDTERRREAGETIIYGRVIDLQEGKIVMELKPSKPEMNPKTKPKDESWKKAKESKSSGDKKSIFDIFKRGKK